MAPIPLDVIGKRFGRLTVISEIPIRANTKNRVRWFKVKCRCGNFSTARLDVLTRGQKKSCGCLAIEIARALLRANNYQLVHGDGRPGKRAAEHICWWGMIQRCEYPPFRDYNYYGGRGIKVCKRWRESYANFLADMGRKPSPKHSIDRIDSNGNYEPGNCRWATALEQSKNQRPRKSKASYKRSQG